MELLAPSATYKVHITYKMTDLHENQGTDQLHLPYIHPLTHKMGHQIKGLVVKYNFVERFGYS